MTLSALKVEGPFRGVSGYDHLTREFVKGLCRLGVEIELHNLDLWASARLPEGTLDPLFAELARPVDATVYLRLGMPHQVLVDRRYVNVNYTMFEATRVHPSWVAQAKTYDLTIVPAAFCVDTWVASGAPRERLAVCPLGIDTELFAQRADPLPLAATQARVRFLNISEVNLRKNTAALARVWRRATTPADDATLVVKLATDEAGIAEWREAFAGGAPVVLFNDRLGDLDLPRLYAAATHYVSLSCGEAWDLPMTEAAASGLELVAPWHSGYREYLDAESAHLLDTAEVPAALPEHDDNYSLFMRGSWWRPDEDQAVEVIRAIVRGDAPAKRSPRNRVLATFTWDAAAAQLLDLLSEVERRKGRRRRWRRRLSTSR